VQQLGGLTREEAAMGVVIAGPDHAENAEAVRKAALSYRELRSMGCDTMAAVGALVLHGGNMAAAGEAVADCLAAGVDGLHVR
jgi:hypothetical protein